MENFTLTDACLIVGILRAAQHKLPVTRTINGTMYEGTAQRIAGADGRDADKLADVRTLSLEVRRGSARYRWPVRELMTESVTGVFMIGSTTE